MTRDDPCARSLARGSGTIHDALARTAGRTFFTCHHAKTSRCRYDDMCEICWDCRSTRGKDMFDTYWPAVTRVQLADHRMLSIDGRSVAHDWRINPL